MLIYRDTREKTGWDFQPTSLCKGTIAKKLDTGDYTIKGLEDDVCIERKSSVSEIATNISDSRFTKELERMKEFKYRYIVCEFSVNDILAFPVGSNIPKYKWKRIKAKGPYIVKRLSQIMRDYDVHILFCGNPSNAEYFAYNLMKNIYESS